MRSVLCAAVAGTSEAGVNVPTVACRLFLETGRDWLVDVSEGVPTVCVVLWPLDPLELSPPPTPTPALSAFKPFRSLPSTISVPPPPLPTATQLSDTPTHPHSSSTYSRLSHRPSNSLWRPKCAKHHTNSRSQLPPRRQTSWLPARRAFAATPGFVALGVWPLWLVFNPVATTPSPHLELHLSRMTLAMLAPEGMILCLPLSQTRCVLYNTL